MGNGVEYPAERPRIFISYVRSDGLVVAEELLTGLRLVGFELYFDRHDISGAAWHADRPCRYRCVHSLAGRSAVRALRVGSGAWR